MKVKQDFTTNSSSASFVISCDEILDKENLKVWLQEEYGKQGLLALEKYTFKGKNIKERFWENDRLNVTKSDVEELDDDKEYIYVDADVEGGNVLATLASSLNNPNLLKGIFYDTWSGFDG